MGDQDTEAIDMAEDMEAVDTVEADTAAVDTEADMAAVDTEADTVADTEAAVTSKDSIKDRVLLVRRSEKLLPTNLLRCLSTLVKCS